ncbi:MAG: M23 family metallopeptidase [Bacteroidales bacterium]|nr:M23 family metallopeptidase [Bacteroidales bacterium]MDD3890829.1 M23 family metallopeptidase [Bacteroidales bacterium]
MKLIHFALSIFLTVFVLNTATAQPDQSPYNLYPPLKKSLGLSGSFGEIRTNSLHTGIDFRTGGQIGSKVYASDDGYVSRLKVSSVGYGNAIYIEHPNGLTTVYGHLHKYSPEIEQYVKEQQYKERSFEVDIHPSPNVITIKRGEVIGLSGNSGSSGGPHLHYEIRKTINQEPQNPAFSNLNITNNLIPVIRGVWLYNLGNIPSPSTINSREEIIVQYKNGVYAYGDTIFADGNLGLGVEAYDYVNSQSLRCGIYSIKMFVNDTLKYHFDMDGFRFNESRYANSHIDYALRQQTGKRAHKLFTEPNNKLRIYKTLKNNGVISTRIDGIYNVRVEISDAYQNKTMLALVVKGLQSTNSSSVSLLPMEQTNGVLWPYFKDNEFSTSQFTVSMPAEALYNSIYFIYKTADSVGFDYSPIISVHNRFTPVHKNYKLTINSRKINENLKSKALIATINTKNEIEAVGGTYSNGSVTARLNYFGDFFVAVDTIAPEIKLINTVAENDYSNEESIMFLVKDNLSGVSSITGTIDGKWALFEYDKKNDIVFYKFDSERLQEGKRHKLSLEVADAKDNISSIDYWFYW